MRIKDMIKSMTGYGRGECIKGERRVVIEISTVNHRYFDANIRMPRSIRFFEEDIRKYVKDHVARGKLDIYIHYYSQAKEDISISINETLCNEYVKAFRKTQQQFDLIDDLSTATLMGLPDIVTVEKNADDKEHIWEVVEKALEDGVIALNKMREKEGKMLKDDLLFKNKNVEEIINQIAKRSPLVVAQYKEKLQQKMTEALADISIDSDRLLTEVAIFSDKASIDEELTRLKSHINQLNSILNEDGVVGRKLDFLIQEINREGNTIGSKANDQFIAKYVVELKSEIEKIREQVQNIE